MAGVVCFVHIEKGADEDGRSKEFSESRYLVKVGNFLFQAPIPSEPEPEKSQSVGAPVCPR